MNLYSRRRVLLRMASSPPAPVHGTWEDLFARIADGTYATAYSIGEILPLDLGTEGEVNAQIVALNTDEKPNSGGYAKITFITQFLTATAKNMNSTSTAYAKWNQCAMRTYLNETIFALIPEAIRTRIVQVKKYTKLDGNPGYSGSETLWLPSEREMFGGTSAEQNGVTYSSYFSTNELRKKKKDGDASYAAWWLRSQRSSGRAFATVTSAGALSYANGYYTSCCPAFGFCID